ncbi:MAG: DEAD/DEAH box helicase, partial [Gammaproteobacteria bacterium]
MSLEQFHPAVSHWFNQAFDAPTEVQLQAWPSIKANNPTLIAAPTGSGKTLAAFLASIDSLICLGQQQGLPETTQILYVSPLKALSNDIEKNLQLPLNGIRDALLESGHADIPVTAAVRTGDTTQSERSKMRRTPPHILVTTPESLYLLLSSASGREMLQDVRSVIIDEIHALAGNKRGAHLSLSLQRLSALCFNHHGETPVRIGLSATQKPIEDMAQFLVGDQQDCTIVDTGHIRERDLAIELPETPLEAILSNDAWDEVYDRLCSFTDDHRTTLVFVNTRRLAERTAHHLAERL